MKDFRTDQEKVVDDTQVSSLISSNPQFRAFVASIDYGIMVGNKAGKIIDFNQAALDIFGYTDEELRGKPITAIMPDRFRAAHSKGMKRYVETRKSKNLGKILRLSGLHKSGYEFPIEIALSSWKDIDGEQYFTASMRRYSDLENNLSLILWSAAIMSVIMFGVLVALLLRVF